MDKVIKIINKDVVLIVFLILAILLNSLTLFLPFMVFGETKPYIKEPMVAPISIYERKAELGDIDIYEIEVALSGIVCLINMSDQTRAYVHKFHFIYIDGEKRSPAQEAGMKIGDRILTVAGFDATVNTSWNIVRRGEKVNFVVLRGEERLFFLINPIYDAELGRYQIGVYVNRFRADITQRSFGTISFFNPETRAFAAFGHRIERETHKDRGYVYGPKHVSRIYNHTFKFTYRSQRRVGYIVKNGIYGAYGFFGVFYTPKSDKLYKIARPGEVYDGPAKMLVKTFGHVPEWIDVEITMVGRNDNGLIPVTLPQGSEMQFARGMSGSVVVQNGKIVGIVARGIVEWGVVLIEPPERMLIEFLLFQQEWERVLKRDKFYNAPPDNIPKV